MKKTLMTFLFLISFSVHCGDPQRIYLNSEEFTTGDVMTVGIDPFVIPCYIFFPNNDGELSYVETQGNITSLYVVGFRFTPCSGGGSTLREEYMINAPSPGEYTLLVNSVGPNTTFPIEPTANFTLIGSIEYSVVGAPPTAVNFLGLNTVFILIFTLLGVAMFNIKKVNKKLIVSLLLMISTTGFAEPKVFHILLEFGEGIPTPENIVQQANTSPSPLGYFLESFNAAPPSKVEYLIEKRPT